MNADGGILSAVRGRLVGMRLGAVLYAAAQPAALALGFIASMLLVRVTSRQELASYLLLQQAVTGGTLLLQMGLPPAVLRFVPTARGNDGGHALRVLRGRLFGIQVAAWLGALPLLAVWPWLVARLDAPELAGAGPLVLAIVVMMTFEGLANAYLRAMRLYGRSAFLAQLVPRGLLFAGLAVLVTAGDEVPWQLLAMLFAGSHVATAVLYAGALATSTRAEAAPRPAAPPPPVGEVLGTTSVMAVRAMVAVFFSACDLWILSWARPHAEVATYGMMLALVQMMTILPGIANLVIPQEFAVLHADGRQRELERLARSAATVVAVLSLTTFTLLLVFGRPLIRIAYGPEYVGGWIVLLVLAAGRLWDAGAGSAGFMLQMTGHHRLLLGLTMGVTGLYLVLGVTLAKAFGGVGMAVASSGAFILLSLLLVGSVHRRIGVRTFAFARPSEWRAVMRRLLGSAPSAELSPSAAPARTVGRVPPPLG